MATEVILPRVDMDMESGKISNWFIAEGEPVVKGRALFEIETDKAAMEVEAPADGVLRGVTGKVGDTLPVGTIVGWIYAVGEAYDAKAAPAAAQAAGGVPGAAPSIIAPAPAPASKAAPVASPAQAASPSSERATPKARKIANEHGLDVREISGSGPRGRVQARDVEAASASAKEAPATSSLPDFSGVNAGPAARRLGRELDVDLNTVKGTGDKGRITREDVNAALGAGPVGGSALPEVPAFDYAKYGPVETLPLSRIKRISGPRLHASWVNIPHVTHNDEADVTELESFRKSLDDAAKVDKKLHYRVSLLPMLMKASVAALKAFPIFNSSLSVDKNSLIYKHYWNIGVAVDTPEGLVVAVVKDVDRKGVIELARELGTLSQKAREGKLSPADMRGATFTISSLGGIGGTAFTPIVNAPEVAILGVVRAKMAPLWDGKAFQPRLMLPLCLSYDHRVVDGAAAARFSRHLAATLEDMRRVLL